ncbi:MAG: MEMAR_RS02690 family S-layer glycoprotein [Methanolinea sp.]|nr:MEMAR_RS02690 family S-layer glycoprotein [Methanolinea sp.]
MIKRFSLALIAVVVLAALMLPASAATIKQVPQGGDVFIGEEGLDVSAAIGTATQVAWFASGNDPATSTPDYVLTVGTPTSFYVSPQTFVGKTGNWYQWAGTVGPVAFNVVDPAIVVKVWDNTAGKDVSGKSVPPGNYLNFRIETNTYSVTARGDAGTQGFVKVRVKTSDGAVYTSLFETTSASYPIDNMRPTSDLWYWRPNPPADGQGWNTGVLDANGARMYKAGTYTVYAELDLNKIKDNYKAPDGSDYTGKTISSTQTVTITADTVKIEASKDVVVRGNPFSVTITGRPNTEYYLWVKGTGQMTGAALDQPPLLVASQKDVTNDPVGGPYTIGSYQYEGGAGRTIKQDVPAAPSNGVYYYAKVKTSNSGTVTVGWQTSQATKDKKYTFRVERFDGSAYKSDEVDVKIEKGTVTVVAAGDQSYFLGQEVKLSGTNSETDTVYLFITGPNLPSQGGKLTDPRTGVVNGNTGTFTTADVLDDNTWEYKWQTANLNIDAGTYTIYAVATPSDKNNLADTQYATVSIIIRKPFVTAVASQSTIAQGDKFYIRGVAEGQPSPGVAIWILGKNYVLYETESVNNDGSFEKEVNQGITANMAAGQYFVVVQHPMYNDILDVYPDGTRTYVVGPYPTANSRIFKLQGAGSLQGSDAAEALVTALDNSYVDDTYTKLQFLIEAPVIRISPITEKAVGEKFEITGTTNLAVDDEILVEVVSSSFKATKKTESGEFSGATGTVKVKKGTEGYNTWSFPVDTANFKPDEYIVQASGVTVDVTTTALFNVVEKPPTTIPTTMPPTTPPTTVVTTVPTTPTPTPTPTSPGFGALVALVGLGAVAFLIVRRH